MQSKKVRYEVLEHSPEHL